MKLSYLKVFFTSLLIILTCGILAIILSWFINLRKIFFYSEITNFKKDIQKATHVYLKNNAEL